MTKAQRGSRGGRNKQGPALARAISKTAITRTIKAISSVSGDLTATSSISNALSLSILPTINQPQKGCKKRNEKRAFKKRNHLHIMRRWVPKTNGEKKQEIIDRNNGDWAYIISPTKVTDLLGGVLFHHVHNVYKLDLQQLKLDAARTFTRSFFSNPDIAKCAWFDFKEPPYSTSLVEMRAAFDQMFLETMGMTPKNAWDYMIEKFDKLFPTATALDNTAAVSDVVVETVIPLLQEEIPAVTPFQSKARKTCKRKRAPRPKKWHDITRITHSAHLGLWRKSAQRTFLSKDTRHPGAAKYVNDSTPYTEVSSYWLAANYKKVSVRNENIVAKKVVPGVFMAGNIHMEAVNVGGTRKKHVDTGDDGSAPALISCSSLSIMCFPSIKCKVLFKPGDLILVKGDIVEHYIEKWWGERYSYVNFFDRNLFTEQNY